MTSMNIALTVNGVPVRGQVEPRTQLCEFLRENLNLTGTHIGCEQGVCGACTVIVDGKPQRSCLSYGGDCDGSNITTIEGFDDDPLMVQLRDAFSRHHALQCGYCTPGMLITARDIILRLGEVKAPKVREELSGNLCRCTGYVGLVEAIEEVSKGKIAGADMIRVRAEALAEPKGAQNLAPGAKTPSGSIAVKAGAAGRDIGKGWSSIEQRLEVAASPDEVWQKLRDVRQVSTCLPGAEIIDLSGDKVTGRMNVSLGPMKIAFNGEGTIEFDEGTKAGRMSGRGRDSGSGSTAEGRVEWQVEPLADASVSQILVVISWRLSGRLAQFNRGGLLLDVVQRLASIFAGNLEASINGGTLSTVEVRTLSVWDLLRSIIGGRLKRWFGK